MNFSFFEKQLARLQAEWPKAYGVEKSDQLWRMYKNRDESELDTAITSAMRSSKTAPTLAEIEQLGRESIKNYDAKDYLNCKNCSGSGWVLAKGTTPTAHACNWCKDGERLRPLVRQELQRQQKYEG